jgi:hypothetical protein
MDVVPMSHCALYALGAVWCALAGICVGVTCTSCWQTPFTLCRILVRRRVRRLGADRGPTARVSARDEHYDNPSSERRALSADCTAIESSMEDEELPAIMRPRRGPRR